MKTSHLSTIITRVKRVTKCNRNEDDKSKLHAVLPHLFNLAEYLTYEKDFSDAEKKEAERLLDLASLPYTVDEEHGLGYYEVASKLLNDGKIMKVPGRRCRRCGKDLSNEKSINRGMGPVCWGKYLVDVEVSTGCIDKTETVQGLDKIAAESDGKDTVVKQPLDLILMQTVDFVHVPTNLHLNPFVNDDNSKNVQVDESSPNENGGNGRVVDALIGETLRVRVPSSATASVPVLTDIHGNELSMQDKINLGINIHEHHDPEPDEQLSTEDLVPGGLRTPYPRSKQKGLSEFLGGGK